jgi:hypothetical protein
LRRQTDLDDSQFPRVVVDLSPEYLQLSNECYNDIQNLTEQTKFQFERQYGMLETLLQLDIVL